MGYSEDFQFRHIMGGSDTLGIVRMVRNTFKIAFVVESSEGSRTNELESLSSKLKTHFTDNWDFSAVDSVDTADAVVRLCDNGGKGLVVSCSRWYAAKNFSELEDQLTSKYYMRIEEKLGDLLTNSR